MAIEEMEAAVETPCETGRTKWTEERATQYCVDMMKKKEEIGLFYAEKDRVIAEIAADIPNFTFQHPETTKVFHFVRPRGKMVILPEFDLEKMKDEDAKALGFDVQRKSRKSE